MSDAPAVFVGALIGALACVGFLALIMWWLERGFPAIVAWFSRSEWQEIDDYKRNQATLRHPSAGGES